MNERIKVNNRDYLTHYTSKKVYRNWWFGKKETSIQIRSLPKRFWGKHIRIKIEVIDLKEGEEDGDIQTD